MIKWRSNYSINNNKYIKDKRKKIMRGGLSTTTINTLTKTLYKIISYKFHNVSTNNNDNSTKHYINTS